MRFLLASLLLTQLGCTAQSSNDVSSNSSSHSSSNSSSNSIVSDPIASNAGPVPAAVKISWQDTANFNPFSVNELYYEIWHNDVFLTAHDKTSITLSIENYPRLVSGCIQVRAVVGDEKSEFTDKTCYES